jgi:transposase
MKKFIRIGVDLAKNYFQVHALENENGGTVTRKLKRSKMHEFFAQIEPCLIGMEACGSAHYWARELKAMGHEVLLMPPAYTKPYLNSLLRQLGFFARTKTEHTVFGRV